MNTQPLDPQQLAILQSFEAQPPEIKQESSSLKSGWWTLQIGLVLMLVPFPLFYVYVPLFLATFVLSIMGLSQGKIGEGVALLLCSLVWPPIFWVLGIAYFYSVIH